MKGPYDDAHERRAVVYDNKVYLAVGQDPEHGEGIGHLWCIDPTKRGDTSSEVVLDRNGKPVAPDANSTLRVSFAHVKGYSPRDGVLYTPQTTLAGMIEKHTGEEPFAVPQFILDAAQNLKAPVKADQIPLDFLADADTTGGNSGSPVVNGRGELVGLNFDRPWENVANDFGYNPAVARNISVDIRFLLWLLEDVQKADFILRELGLKR